MRGIWKWAVFLSLMAVGVPWYWHLLPLDGTQRVVGFPLWVAVSIGASLLVSIFTSALLYSRWPDELDDESKEAR